MRTLVGAADPPPRRPVDGYTFSRSTTGNMTDAVISFLTVTGLTVNPWQAVVIREAHAEREPYRTTAYVGEAVPEIEGG